MMSRPPFHPHRELHVSPVPVALPRLERLGVRHRVLEVLAGGHGGRAWVPVRVDHGGGDVRLTDKRARLSESSISIDQ